MQWNQTRPKEKHKWKKKNQYGTRRCLKRTEKNRVILLPSPDILQWSRIRTGAAVLSRWASREHARGRPLRARRSPRDLSSVSDSFHWRRRWGVVIFRLLLTCLRCLCFCLSVPLCLSLCPSVSVKSSPQCTGRYSSLLLCSLLCLFRVFTHRDLQFRYRRFLRAMKTTAAPYLQTKRQDSTSQHFWYSSPVLSLCLLCLNVFAVSVLLSDKCYYSFRSYRSIFLISLSLFSLPLLSLYLAWWELLRLVDTHYPAWFQIGTTHLGRCAIFHQTQILSAVVCVVFLMSCLWEVRRQKDDPREDLQIILWSILFLKHLHSLLLPLWPSQHPKWRWSEWSPWWGAEGTDQEWVE